MRNALFTIMPQQPAMTPRNALLNVAPQPGEVTPADAWQWHSQNAADAWTAAQDPQTWRDAASAYGQALVAGSVAPGGNALGVGIRAYHGSPHSFDAFDLGKIGTGEGAQAYGHGLYFAENEGIARSYRDALAGYDWNRTASGAPISSNLARMLEDGYAAAESQGVRRPTARDAAFMAQKSLDAQKADALAAKDFDWFSQVQDHSAELDRINRDLPQPAGHMYEVGINADPEHMLDWDKPLSQQSQHVRDALGQTSILYHADNMGLRDPTGRDLMQNVIGDHPSGVDGLRAAGIPGIRYLDGSSRSAGAGTSNYVVFDPATIEILRKYGIAGLIGGGAAAAAGQPPGSAQQ